jgi:hypothetical protein
MSPEVQGRLTCVRRDAVVVQVRGPLGPAGAQLLCARARQLLLHGDLVVDLQGPVDLGVVEALARIALLAKRLGACVSVTGDDQGLLALTGLEVLRQAEAGEQAGVQEVVDVLDPPV